MSKNFDGPVKKGDSLIRTHPLLGRRISRQEYERVVNAAVDLGFEELYTQEVDDRELSPDFEKERPFDWDGQGGEE